jgi:hypothetical protein
MKLGVRVVEENSVFVATQARRPKKGDLTTEIRGSGATEVEAVADLAAALVVAGIIKYQKRKPTVRKPKEVAPPDSIPVENAEPAGGVA